MRQTTHAVLGVFLAVVSCGYGLAEESQWWWWPFGDGQDAQASAAPPPSPSQEAANGDATDASWPALPTLKWPDFSTPSGPHAVLRDRRTRSRHRGGGAPIGGARNVWAKPPNPGRAEPPIVASPWATVTNGAHRVQETTRNAWHKTLDVLVPGDVSSPVAAPRETRTAWWRRLWRTDEQEPEGPRTVTEWMAQERLDP